MLKKILLSLIIFVLVVALGGYLYYRFAIYEPPLISEQDRSSISLMPLPAELKLKNGEFIIDEEFGVSFQGVETERLIRAKTRFLETVSAKTQVSFREDGKGLSINCLETEEAYPQLDSDESYTIDISSSNISLTANTEYGILHGLETIVQLIDGNVIPEAEIKDKPRFLWRGIMIDISRHWIPKEVILRNLEAMAAVKLNVLHLHLSDDQGFRLESKVFPLLHEKGSNGKYLTQEEMSEIIEFAADRGIRVVPEFDVPGHTKSWLIAYPHLSSSSMSMTFGRKKGDDIFSIPIDPSNPEVYHFLDTLIGEMSKLFPDRYFHSGGDEVNPKFWNENEQIASFMAANNLKDGHELQAYFNAQLNPIIRKHGKIMMGWEEILHPELSSDVLIQSWKSHKSLFEGAQHGSQAILSTGLYLDHKLSSGNHYMVDPLVLSGAVDIVPDSGMWKMYDMVMEVPGNSMESQLVVFDRDPANVFGFFAFLNQRNAFKGGKIENDIITFTFDAGVGMLDYEAELSNDSIKGAISFGIMNFNSVGYRSGGSDMAGTEMPKIEIVKPLTEEEKKRVLGAEAAMWSEVVSSETVESRIWPRSAAVAEKLWSPQSLTNDEDDMYRRLVKVSNQLEAMGIQHISYVDDIVESWGLTNDGSIKQLLSVLEEAKYYDRMAMFILTEEIYLPDVRLNHVADAAAPESFYAREFNNLVKEYAENPTEQGKQKIHDELEIYAGLYENLEADFVSSDILSEAKNLTEVLSKTSRMALGKVDGNIEQQKEEIEQALTYLENGENGIVVAVVPSLRLILTGDNNP